MFKWLILGLVVALVSYWSPKQVQAQDDPMSEEELEELEEELKTLTRLEELNQLAKLSELGNSESESSDLDKSEADFDVNCEEDCQFSEDPYACEAACEDEIYRKVIEQVGTQKDKQETVVAKKGIRKKGWPRDVRITWQKEARKLLRQNKKK